MLGFFWFFGFFLLGILKTNRTKEGKGRKKGSREEERNAGQAMEKRQPCYADGRDVNCQRPLGRSVWCLLKYRKNRATEHTALPLLGFFLGKAKH